MEKRFFKKEIKQRVADILATKLMPKLPTTSSERCPKCTRLAPTYSTHPNTRCVQCGTVWCAKVWQKSKPLVPNFYIMDSSIEKYLTVFMKRSDIPHFIRKTGMFGMIWERGLCIPVGSASKEWDALQVHIVTDDDCVDLSAPTKVDDPLDKYRT